MTCQNVLRAWRSKASGAEDCSGQGSCRSIPGSTPGEPDTFVCDCFEGFVGPSCDQPESVVPALRVTKMASTSGSSPQTDELTNFG